MAKKIKKGSYWRLLGTITEVRYVALEDGWSNMTLNFAVVTKDNTGAFHRFCIDTDKLYRCKKDGSWFQPSAIQHENTKWLSLQWQAKGALASLHRVASQAGLRLIQDRINDLEESLLYELNSRRKNALDSLREKANES